MSHSSSMQKELDDFQQHWRRLTLEMKYSSNQVVFPATLEKKCWTWAELWHLPWCIAILDSRGTTWLLQGNNKLQAFSVEKLSFSRTKGKFLYMSPKGAGFKIKLKSHYVILTPQILALCSPNLDKGLYYSIKIYGITIYHMKQ